MGSINDDTDYAKGQHPSLSWVQIEIDKWNEKCRRRAAAAPFRYKLLAAIGKPKRYIKWQQDHWYDKFE